MATWAPMMASQKRRGNMENKKLPVDRGKLLIGLEHCQVDVDHCETCPYSNDEDCCSIKLRDDARSYIYYLEEQLKEAREHDCG